MDGFGKRLKQFRTLAGMTQSEFSEKLNTHMQTVSKWEREISEPDIATLGEISVVLGIGLGLLLGTDEDNRVIKNGFDAERFGSFIAALRKHKNQNQATLAKGLNVSTDTVSKWERGIICPDIQKFVELAAYHNVSAIGLYYCIADIGAPQEQPVMATQSRVGDLGTSSRGNLAGDSGECVHSQGDYVQSRRTIDGERNQSIAQHSADVALLRPKHSVSASSKSPTQSRSRRLCGDSRADKRSGIFRIALAVCALVLVLSVILPVATRFSCSSNSYNSQPENRANVDYWLNGGVLLDEPVLTLNKSDGRLQLPVPIKENATFEGWFTTPDYSGEAITHLTYRDGNVSIYAKWSDKTFGVKYILNGGIMYDKNPDVISAQTSFELNNPVRRGYVFLGWFDSECDGKPYTTIGGANSLNIVLYAYWQKSDDKFNIVYDLCGGTIADANPTQVGAGEVVTLAPPKKFGYDFIGWNDKSTGDGNYHTTLYGVSADIVLYAVWSPQTYTVVYHLNGGTYEVKTNPVKIKYGDAVVLEPVCLAGHTFNGWTKTADGDEYITKLDASNIASTDALYARFTKNVYTVKLDGDGGSFVAPSGEHCGTYDYSLTFGDELELPIPAKAGYIFSSWVADDGKAVTKIDVANTGNVTLTATYISADRTYTVTFDTAGGTLEQGNSLIVACRQVVKLPVPTRDGYLFVRWQTQSGNAVEYTSDTAEQDVALIAVWQEIRVSGEYTNFAYSKGATSVEITSYTGKSDINIAINIPSYIGGLPVTQLSLGTDKFVLFALSITIPDTVRVLSDRAFYNVIVTNPVTIPASVESIGAECFALANIALVFADGSKLKTIPENAFLNAAINGSLVLPEGVERLCQYAFKYMKITNGALVLPQTLKTIECGALTYYCATSLPKMNAALGDYSDVSPNILFLPDGIQKIERNAFSGLTEYNHSEQTGAYFDVYTTLTPTATSAFPTGWDAFESGRGRIRYVTDAVITLIDGDYTLTERNACILPIRQKDGFTFVGWRKTGGAITDNKFFFCADNGDITLTAEYAPIADNDGKAINRPMLLGVGTHTIELLHGERFWFWLPSNARLYITYTVEYKQSEYARNVYVRRFDSETSIYGGILSGSTLLIEYDNLFAIFPTSAVKVTINIESA